MIQTNWCQVCNMPLKEFGVNSDHNHSPEYRLYRAVMEKRRAASIAKKVELNEWTEIITEKVNKAFDRLSFFIAERKQVKDL